MASFRKWFDFAERCLLESSGALLVFGWLFGMSAMVLGFTTVGCYLFHGRTDWVMTMDWLSTGVAYTAWWLVKIGIVLMVLRLCLTYGGRGCLALFSRSES